VGRGWLTIDGDSLRVAFECDERLRGPLESMSGELVDFRLAAHARPVESENDREIPSTSKSHGVKNNSQS
jgi:hypothetical protein